MRTNQRSSSENWMGTIQKELSLQLKKYMDEKGLNPTQLSKELGVPKGYISQVLQGRFNYSLGKFVDLSIAVGVVPRILFQPIQETQLQAEKKIKEKRIRLNGNASLFLKSGNIDVVLHRYENGTSVFVDVHQTCTITPTDKKIA